MMTSGDRSAGLSGAPPAWYRAPVSLRDGTATHPTDRPGYLGLRERAAEILAVDLEHDAHPGRQPATLTLPGLNDLQLRAACDRARDHDRHLARVN